MTTAELHEILDDENRKWRNDAFQICLDLLEHLKGADDEQREAD